MVRTHKYTAFTGKKRLDTLMGMERVILLELCLEMNANFNVQKITLVKSNFITKALAKVSGRINFFPYARPSLFDTCGSALGKIFRKYFLSSLLTTIKDIPNIIKPWLITRFEFLPIQIIIQTLL